MDTQLAHQYNEIIRNELINRREGEPVNEKAINKLLKYIIKQSVL